MATAPLCDQCGKRHWTTQPCKVKGVVSVEADVASQDPPPVLPPKPESSTEDAGDQSIQSKGGKARAAKMTPEERSEHARKMNRAKWDKE